MRAAPVTAARIEACLRGKDMHVLAEKDGVTGIWEEHRFWFYLAGEDRNVLQIRGRGGRTAPVDRRGEVLQAVNDWNRDRIFPKCYLREEGDRIAVYTELSVPVGSGLSDAQLSVHVDCGLGTGLRFLASLPEDLVPPAPTDEG